MSIATEQKLIELERRVQALELTLLALLSEQKSQSRPTLSLEKRNGSRG